LVLVVQAQPLQERTEHSQVFLAVQAAVVLAVVTAMVRLVHRVVAVAMATQVAQVSAVKVITVAMV
jgi:hypothetical protein